MKKIGAYLRYRFAFKRMDEAMEEGWLMEAITIQESILSGRLLSALNYKEIKVNPRDSFSSLIDRFRKYLAHEDALVEPLATRLHEWRIKRNHTLHSICRDIDDPYDENTVTKFENQLVDTAGEGRTLVEELRSIVDKIKRRI